MLIWLCWFRWLISPMGMAFVNRYRCSKRYSPNVKRYAARSTVADSCLPPACRQTGQAGELRKRKTNNVPCGLYICKRLNRLVRINARMGGKDCACSNTAAVADNTALRHVNSILNSAPASYNGIFYP